LNEMNVYANVTYVTVVSNNLEWDECLCKCYITIVLKVKMKKLEWDECLCKCYITIVLIVNKELYQKSWLRWMFM
jgi:hypothetical protein